MPQCVDSDRSHHWTWVEPCYLLQTVVFQPQSHTHSLLWSHEIETMTFFIYPADLPTTLLSLRTSAPALKYLSHLCVCHQQEQLLITCIYYVITSNFLDFIDSEAFIHLHSTYENLYQIHTLNLTNFHFCFTT